MRTRVTVFHNVSRHAMLTGYERGDVLVPVATWTVRPWHDPGKTAEAAFALLNVGDDPAFGPPDPRAVEYRDRGNRSASVGDLVRVGNHWLAVAHAGFTEVVDWPAGFSLVPCWAGSNPLSDEDIPQPRWRLALHGIRRLSLHRDGASDARS
jgi:hypothetical protein